MMGMDRAILREHLAEAERNTVSGKQRIAEQQAIITELEGNGGDARQAKESLVLLLKMQDLFVKFCYTLNEELKGD